MPSAITMRKLAQPLFIDEPGAEVTYYYAVTNSSQVDSVDITSLVDDRLGDLAGQGDCTVPQSLAPGAVYGCSVTTFLAGDGGDIVVNNVVAAGLDDDGNDVEDDAQATVRVRDLPPGLVTVKSASPPSLQEPGGSVTFEFTTTNTSAVDVLTIDAMVDSVFGDLNGRGDCQVPQQLQPGASYSCSFTEMLSGAPGETHVNQVLVSGLSEDDDPVSAQSSAIVRFLGLPLLPNVKPVPTIGQLAAAMLVMLMAGLGIRAMRRRRALDA